MIKNLRSLGGRARAALMAALAMASAGFGMPAVPFYTPPNFYRPDSGLGYGRGRSGVPTARRMAKKRRNINKRKGKR